MWSTRTVRALAAAALLSIPTVVPASASPGPAPAAASPADLTRGSVAPVATLDQPDAAGVACVFVTRGNFPVVTEVRAAPPLILWPDRRPGDPAERGRVTWRIVVQAGTGEISPTWKRIAVSRVRTGIARESTAATLTGVRVAIPAGRKRWLRVMHQVTWVARDGRVLGSLRRIQRWTSWVMDGREGWVTDTPCLTTLSKTIEAVPSAP